MSNIRVRKQSDYKEGQKRDKAGYFSFGSENADENLAAMNSYAAEFPEETAIARSNNDFIGIDSSRTSIKSSYHRGDYEHYRPNEATPWRSKDVIKKSMEICEDVGRIKEIFSLMADFTCQGINLQHPVPATDRLYKNWFKEVKGAERSERFCYYLLSQGNVPIYRKWGKQKVKDIKKWKSVHSTTTATARKVDGIDIKKHRIPIKYKFLNIMTIEPEYGDDNPLYGLDEKEQYYLKLTRGVQEALRSGVTSDGILTPIKKMGLLDGTTKRKPLKKDNFTVHFYKKDDWKPWATPVLRSIFRNVAMLRKLELADASALDGIISSVRLWRLGSLDHKIAPNGAMINKLRNVLATGSGGGTLDLIWGPDLDFKESDSNSYKFLGPEKYQSTLDAIYSGLGVPPALRGVSGEGLGNNFISLQTFIERLQYIRTVLVEFWTTELKIFQAALGLPSLPTITFDKMVLGDETAEKQLLLSLVDRGIISEEAMQVYCGFVPKIEDARNEREEKMREKGKKAPKASPYHNPQLIHELKKIFAQQGEVTPSEVGLELEERKEGETTKMETMTDTQLKLAKEKGGSGSQNLPNSRKPNGDAGGRPKNSKDTQKRKQRKISPQTTAFVNTYAWASSAQQIISETVTPKYLQSKGKKNLRSLSAQDKAECESLKQAILFSLPVYAEISPDEVYKLLEDNVQLDENVTEAISSCIAEIHKSTGKNATVDEIRDICAIIYSLEQD